MLATVECYTTNNLLSLDHDDDGGGGAAAAVASVADFESGQLWYLNA